MDWQCHRYTHFTFSPPLSSWSFTPKSLFFSFPCFVPISKVWKVAFFSFKVLHHGKKEKKLNKLKVIISLRQAWYAYDLPKCQKLLDIMIWHLTIRRKIDELQDFNKQKKILERIKSFMLRRRLGWGWDEFYLKLFRFLCHTPHSSSFCLSRSFSIDYISSSTRARALWHAFWLIWKIHGNLQKNLFAYLFWKSFKNTNRSK